MKIPEGRTEADVLAEIDRVVRILAREYKFGYYDVEDIEQEGRIFAIKVMDKYDPSKPLSNFLHVVIKRHLINIIRNKYHRNDPPCKICHGAIEGNTAHADHKICVKYKGWKKRNSSKAGLVCPLDISNLDDADENNTKFYDTGEESLSRTEIFNLIDLKLSADLRADYLKLKAGVSIPKARKDLIVKTIKEILTEGEIGNLIQD